MPTSKLNCWPAILRLVAECQPKKVLDIGPGCGKAGILLREYVGGIERLDAIEAEARYRDRFPWLESVYDHVEWDFAELRPREMFDPYDLVLMVDVLEHIDTTSAITLLANIPCHVIISTPSDFFQNPEADEYPTERHRSYWTFDVLNNNRPVDRHCVNINEHFGQLIVRLAPIQSPVVVT